MSKAADTRRAILEEAFGLVYVYGFQATSIEDILARTKVTKGAFFYHFKNKDEMGLAMINELMYPSMYEMLVQPLQHSDDPVNSIYRMMKALLLGNYLLKIEYGCPAANMVQEMSPLNAEFNAALVKLTTTWQQTLVACVQRGKKAGKIRKNVNGSQLASFVMSGYWGVRNLGKLYLTTDCYKSYLKELKTYLATLS